jgi:hypothetical protein
MKLFAATLALASAQDLGDAGDDARTFSFGDSASFAYDDSYAGFGAGSFYDSAYGSDYGSLAAAYNYDDADAAAADADAAVADEAGRDKDEARYFGVSVSTTPPPTTTTYTTTEWKQRYCLKCDVMSTSECAVAGSGGATEEGCEANEVCFLELRRSTVRAPSGKAVTQICTGCKNRQACWDLKQQNSVTGLNKFRDLSQCHPTNANNNSPRLGDVTSVCRTCFAPSDVTFASATTKSDKFLIGNANNLSFTIPNGSGISKTVTLYGSSDSDFNEIWFTSRHGISHVTSYDFDFSMDALA